MVVAFSSYRGSNRNMVVISKVKVGRVRQDKSNIQLVINTIHIILVERVAS
jgi:hypothetical protein